MKRYTPLRARRPIRRLSDSRKARLAAETPILARIRARRGGLCVLFGPTCWGPTDAHHVLPRGRGGTTVPENIALLCRGHHDAVHSRPEWGRRIGLLR